MVEARPLEELRILLHPALVDTPLGRHVVQIDRLVDTYVGTRPGQPYYCSWRGEESKAVAGQFMLYECPWSLRLGVLAEVIKKSGGDAGRLQERAEALSPERRGAPRPNDRITSTENPRRPEGQGQFRARGQARLLRPCSRPHDPGRRARDETLEKFDTRVREACKTSWRRPCGRWIR